jgi:bacteriocin biosynthesis cyclodehydratase domain-containing protein
VTDLTIIETERSDEQRAASSERLMLNPYVRVLRCSDDEIVVRHGTRSLYSEVISDATRKHVLARLVDRLGAPATRAELAIDVPCTEDGMLDEAVTYLLERRVLVPETQDWRPAYFDTFYGRSEGLAQHAIGVIGDGALARRMCTSLAALSPEAILVLGDSPSGYPDAVELRSAVEPSALARVFTDSDFVAVLPDRYSPRVLHLANEAALATDTPWMCAFFDGHEAVIGPAFVPGQSGCYAEFESQAEASLMQINESLLLKEALYRDGEASGVLPQHHVDVAGGFAVDAVIRLLLGGTSYAVGRAMRIDFERASVDYQNVLTLPRCPACQHTRGPYRHLFM